MAFGRETRFPYLDHNLVDWCIGRLFQLDRLLEVAWDCKVLWEWKTSDHVDELGFDAEARAVIRQASGFNRARDSFDWLHINAAAYLGPNHWFDEGDQRFAPENIIISSREANIIAIVNRAGKIVWRMGPDYRESEALRKLGQIIGQHNPHIIPKGLAGAGNLLVFDNGGAAGYGFASPALSRSVSNRMTVPLSAQGQWTSRLTSAGVGRSSTRADTSASSGATSAGGSWP